MSQKRCLSLAPPGYIADNELHQVLVANTADDVRHGIGG